MEKQKRWTILIYYALVMVILPIFLESYWIKIAFGNQALAQQLAMIYFYLSHFVLFIGGIFGLYRKEYSQFFKNWRQHILKNIGWSLLGFIMMLVITSILMAFIPQQSSNQAVLEQLGQQTSGLKLVLLALVTVIIGPINEELVFRTALMSQVKKRSSMIFYIILSAILFGAVHVHSLKEWIVGVVYAGSGLALALNYAWSKNSLTNTTSHILNNTLAFLAILK